MLDVLLCVSMLGEEKMTKAQIRRRRKAEKRKASTSPDTYLYKSSTQPLTTSNSNSTCSKTQHNVCQQTVGDAFTQNSIDFVATVMNPSQVLNFAQQVPYGFQSQPQTKFSPPQSPPKQRTHQHGPLH